MANTRSAEKRNLQAQKRRMRNTAVRTTVKGAVKKAREALIAKDPAQVQVAVRAAAKVLSQAASKGVLHPRNASRRIARLMHAASSGSAPRSETGVRPQA